MNLIEASPADWLRDLLVRQPEIREATFDTPPNAQRLVVISRSGVRLTISVNIVQSW